ncbi:putative transcriptional regulator YdeE [Paenibacillus shirakamiensis]|uniref:Transcriptional regulator YdeE n=1 Tax=Paenibacillus shirakamiensis TaxID=1265935 RepID=A0ABS4JEH6_9BACL|nr:GyrI-like domain-containing protein [Paenibacillus shirakamiensis]MBP2000085.1 putative transcriptional regulator YdeE [Paenibacillus shirakamiensis]
MQNYSLEEKDSFTVLGIGTEIKSDYKDFKAINQEKKDFWLKIQQDGTLERLQDMAKNDYIFTVHEAINNKMMYYAGVLTEVVASEPHRLIQFPKGEYLVIKGEEKTAEVLSTKLAGTAFGQVLPEAKDFAYVGGPNTIVEMGQRDGLVYGEMWIPVVKKS